MLKIDTQAAIDRLLRFLAVPGVTGEEGKIAREIGESLKAAGVPPKSIHHDDANARIPVPTQTGNLVVVIPGAGALANAPRQLFMTHLDTVPLCAGAKPVRKGKKIVNEAETALGGDNRTGCAVLVTLAAELIQQRLPHPPITLLFTVREESGLYGARHLNPAEFDDVAMGFNFDGRSAADVFVGAVGADRWEAELFGKASHAGVAPERGISALMIFAHAMTDIHANGWWGKVNQGGREGASNVGPVGGKGDKAAGDATNVVTDYVLVKGESRSHDARFFKAISNAYRDAFAAALKKVLDHEGKPGRMKFASHTDYFPFKIPEKAPVVAKAGRAVAAIGRTPNIRVANGGLDANWMVKHNIPTVTFGAGQNDIHTVKEWIDLVEFEAGCQLAVALATGV